MKRLRNRGRVHRAPLLVPGLLALATSAGVAGGQEFDVDHQAKNLVRFVSRTTVQSFDGTTDRIDGYVLLGRTPLGPASAGGSELYFEVDLASLDTGIGLRNRHMRDEYLEVARYPFATYQGRVVQVDSADGGVRVTSQGTFSLHGVDKTMRISCDVVGAGDGYRATCAFPVRLSDFNVAIPRVMFLKLADEIELNLDFTVAPVKSPNGGTP